MRVSEILLPGILRFWVSVVTVWQFFTLPLTRDAVERTPDCKHNLIQMKVEVNHGKNEVRWAQ